MRMNEPTVIIHFKWLTFNHFFISLYWRLIVAPKKENKNTSIVKSTSILVQRDKMNRKLFLRAPFN